ncbi:hypothetical protein VNO80_15215 [Phaseolus coccineus]|uniref:Uncharacterized protein n=1 Tax=Phaseolus coccineus TaxID=3886 RepID=A0AAN9MJH4_PHACN
MGHAMVKTIFQFGRHADYFDCLLFTGHFDLFIYCPAQEIGLFTCQLSLVMVAGGVISQHYFLMCNDYRPALPGSSTIMARSIFSK